MAGPIPSTGEFGLMGFVESNKQHFHAPTSDMDLKYHWVFAEFPVYPHVEGASIQLLKGTETNSNPMFAALVERFQRRVYAQVLGLLGHPGDAEEATQETFVKAYEHWSTLRDPAAFPGWIGKIASRVATDRIRSTVRHRSSAQVEEYAGPHPFDPVETDERATALWQAVRDLQIDYRTAFLLVHLEGLTYGEVADQLGVPLSTVEGRMYKARQILREKLRWL